MIGILGGTFFSAEIIIIIITYYHSLQRYKYIINNYDNKQISYKKYFIAKKENFAKDIVISNMTQKIDTDALNKELYYPTLKFSLNGEEINSIILNQEKTFIGRSKSDDITIDEPTISRSQCFITRDDKNKYFINIDLRRNPIFINQNRVISERKELFDGDIIFMGNGKISFEFVMLSNNN